MQRIGHKAVLSRVGIVSIIVSIGTSVSGTLFAQNLTWIGSAPEIVFCEARGVSADGMTVVGKITDISRQESALQWVNGVIYNLGSLGGFHSRSYSVSLDGTVVVGWAYNSNWLSRAFRWENGIVGYGINSATEKAEGFLLDT